MSGLGGDGFYHAWNAKTGASTTYNGTGAAPAAATIAHYRAAGSIPVQGPLSIQTPGMVAGIAALHGAEGSKPWGALFGPAIEAARDGFTATHALRHFAGENRARLAPDALSAALFLPEGKPPALGHLLVQPALAATLQRLASAGPQDFYQGGLAAMLAADLEKASALVRAADLQAVSRHPSLCPIAVLNCARRRPIPWASPWHKWRASWIASTLPRLAGAARR
jgi:gamma-glutamyltranspeptidase/glutathione hydrolase